MIHTRDTEEMTSHLNFVTTAVWKRSDRDYCRENNGSRDDKYEVNYSRLVLIEGIMVTAQCLKIKKVQKSLDSVWIVVDDFVTVQS